MTAGGHSAAHTLARSVKRRRLERAISLSELARRSGVSKATLSSLERGNGNPSVDTVWALAKALNVPFGELFDDHEDDPIQVHRMEDAQVVAEEDGYRGRRLLSRQGRGGFELYVLDLDEGARRDAAGHSPGVVEHVLVIGGRVELGPDDGPATLEAGDYLTFAADLPHHYHALDGGARVLSLHDYPQSV
jgi:transcriptional regulator with XRE-family HTH domain